MSFYKLLKNNVVNNKGYTKCSCGNHVTHSEQYLVVKCQQCYAYHFTFTPTYYQQAIIDHPSRYLFSLGGYGSGKSYANCMKLVKHCLTVNQAAVAVSANTLQQLKTAILPILFSLLHPDWIVHQTQQQITLVNGSVIYLVPSNNPDKLKSMNLTYGYLVEANSNKMQEMFEMLKTRIRNHNAVIYAKDDQGNYEEEYDLLTGTYHRKIIRNYQQIVVEANPSLGWIRDYGVLNATNIYYTTSVKNMEYIFKHNKPVKQNNLYQKYVDHTCFLTASVDNPYLPVSYVDSLIQKNDQKGLREVYCDMSLSDDLVFSEIFAQGSTAWVNNQQQIHFLPYDHLVCSYDPGGSGKYADPSCFIMGKYNSKTKSLIIFDGFYHKSTTLKQDISAMQHLFNKYQKTARDVYLFTADSVINNTDKTTGLPSIKQQINHYLNLSITPVKKKEIMYGVNIMNEWFKQQRLQIDIQTPMAYEEMNNYRYVYKKGTVTLSDKMNHFIDALRYLVLQLELGKQFQADIKNPHVQHNQHNTIDFDLYDLYVKKS